MADLIDSAAGELQQASNQLTRAGVRTSVAIAAGTTRVSARIGARAAGGTVRGVVALLDAVRQATRSRSQDGQVSLRRFTHLVDGKREVVPIRDAEVARQLARELRRHGVTFAVERHADGSRTFHVQGKDAALIEHALTQASIRVDERIMRARERAEEVEQAQADPMGQEAGSRTIQLDEEQKATLVDALRGSQDEEASDDLTEQIERDGEVTLTEENAEAIDQALTGGAEHAEHMRDVVAAVDEERAALAVAEAVDADVSQPEHGVEEVPDATVSLVLSGQERDALVSQVQSAAESQPAGELPQLAETIQSTSQVELTPANVERLEAVFAQNGWTPGVDGDQTPEHMRWVVDGVAEERQILEERVTQRPEPARDLAAAVSAEAQAPENPYLRADLPTQAVAAPVAAERALGDDWDAPAEVRSERAEDAALVPDAATKDAPQKPAPDDSRQGSSTQSTTRDRELSPRDATRERVAKKIDTKVTEMKEQQKSATRPASRGPQRPPIDDEPRTPQTRR